MDPTKTSSPETVGERLHGKLGDAVAAAVCRHPAQYRSHVDHAPSGFLDQGKESHGHADHTVHVDLERAVEVFHFHPLGGTHGQRAAGVIHNTPEPLREGMTEKRDKYKTSIRI